MPSTTAKHKTEVWPKDWTSYYIESIAIILLAVLTMSLQHSRLDLSILVDSELWIRVLGSMSVWFANKLALEHLLQSRIDSNKVTQLLPFELVVASISVTTIIYLIFYPLFIYLNYLRYDLANFLQGLFLTCGLSLLIVIFYAGNQLWKSWWSDGEFLFRPKDSNQISSNKPEYISIKNAKGTVNHDLKNVDYFISESKVVFLVDSTGKKWVTQYTLTELEDMLGIRFFRLNRRILVGKQVISQIKKLPNHRLLVTIQQSDDTHEETISRYKSTRFKQWFDTNE